MKPAQIFISYSKKDAHWREEFERMLAPVRERGLIGVWSDEHIAAGEDWRKNIQTALATTRVALLLVSDHFLNTDFITRVELPEIMNAAKNGRVSIRWVPISDALHKYSDLANVQACCDPRKPLAHLSNAAKKAAIQKICDEIIEEFGVTKPNISLSRRGSLFNQVQERLGDKYEMMDEIGSGKFSIIYRAVQRQPKRTVVVKVLVASELDDWARGQFVKGVERSSELTSPAFIKIIDSFMDEPPEFLISEFVEGEQLSSILRNYPQGLSLAEVRSILYHLAKALEDAHEHGFWRGEMCPSDILIEALGSPRLSPFDFSNLLREEGRMRGTFLADQESLAYMSPERYFGQPSTVLTDQFSLGIIATELLGGPRIPRVTRPSDLELKRSLFKDLESGKGEWAKRSRDFTGVVCPMLRTDPEARWPSDKRGAKCPARYRCSRIC